MKNNTVGNKIIKYIGIAFISLFVALGLMSYFGIYSVETALC